MENMMSMSINDSELDVVTGGISGSVPGSSIKYAISTKRTGFSDNVSRIKDAVVRKRANGTRKTVMTGQKPRLILL